MINLFHIKNYEIKTKSFDHWLHGSIVTDFEKAFCKYVGARYSCSFNSATSALFLCLMMGRPGTVNIPSLIPPVVLNAIIQSGNHIEFVDNISWVGNSYIFHNFPGYKIIDSAQKVERNQFKKEAHNNDLMVFSFYPTKPIGSCDGGMVVSNDREKIEYLRTMTLNGMTQSKNSWDRQLQFPGWKMYMNSIQAYIALENLKKLDEKKAILKKIRDMYNRKLGNTNQSDHLYRICVKGSNNLIIDHMKKKYRIICGKHYDAAHLMDVYSQGKKWNCPMSEITSKLTLSIPFHEKLSIENIYTILNIFKNENILC